MRPPRGRTWARRGQTPIVHVTGKGSGRVSLAGLVCVKPGQRTRLVYRAIAYHGRKGEKKGFGIPELQALVRSAHHLLRGPIVVVWDNLSAHVGPTMRTFIDAHAEWLTVFRLPAYAPELNPAEGVWANLKGKLINLAPRSLDQCRLTGYVYQGAERKAGSPWLRACPLPRR
ncbi:DDE endonuclease [Microbispora triticiradicis]|nr:DDE endonuclease [Microbispora triticiradicis]